MRNANALAAVALVGLVVYLLKRQGEPTSIVIPPGEAPIVPAQLAFNQQERVQ